MGKNCLKGFKLVKEERGSFLLISTGGHNINIIVNINNISIIINVTVLFAVVLVIAIIFALLLIRKKNN